jgi:hypothetical protein
MGGLTRRPLDHVAPTVPRFCVPAPVGVTLLTNCCVAPGCKVLAKDGWMVACLELDQPADGYDYDTIIVSPGDQAG